MKQSAAELYQLIRQQASQSATSVVKAEGIVSETKTPDGIEILDVKDITKVEPKSSLDKESGADKTPPEVDGIVATAITAATKSQATIIFVDPFGTRWTFPYEDSKTWDVSHAGLLFCLSLLNLCRTPRN